MDGAFEVAESIRRGVLVLAIAHAPALPAIDVSVSVGVFSGECRQERPSTEFIEKADARLHVAKSRGRNIVVRDETLRSAE